MHKSWDNRVGAKRGAAYQTWSRRVRWYNMQAGRVKLVFENEERSWSTEYDDVGAANRDWERFKRGEI